MDHEKQMQQPLPVCKYKNKNNSTTLGEGDQRQHPLHAFSCDCSQVSVIIYIT